MRLFLPIAAYGVPVLVIVAFWNPPVGDWLDKGADLATIFGLLVGPLGLVLVARQLRTTVQAQRVADAPYVRVDVVPTEHFRLSNYTYPAPYFRDSSRVEYLGPTAHEDVISVSAVFRNYQSNPLGFALRPTATFVCATTAGTASRARRRTIEIPYLEYGKAVEVELFRFPRASETLVRCLAVTFTDILHHEVKKAFDDADPKEGWHGRLTCRWDGTEFVSDPYSQSAS